MATLIVALDHENGADALRLVDRLEDMVAFYKVGSPLFTREGPDFVRALTARGRRVFLDLKFHDIPNTVAHAVASAADLGVDLITLHTTGGAPMLRAAVEAAGTDGPRLLGVTVLTSFGADDILTTWGKEVRSIREEVTRLAGLARDCGLHGVVASALEADVIRRHHGPDFLIVTPGIRPAGASVGDQIRVATPADAARAGADFIVVGRPIIAADDPVAVAREVVDDLENALSGTP